ncbi:MAG: DinB family protein [Planctomycetota bacterium]|nr:DinB family protein [Planctomycetota bacterium]
MTELERLRRLFAYDAWCHRRMLAALRGFQGEARRSLKQFGHILVASRTWLARLRGEDTSGVDLWPDLDVLACKRLLEENAGGFEALFAGLKAEELNEPIAYTNTRGERHRTPRIEILQHLVLHSAYHRGQLTQAFMAEGGAPVATDFILFVREHPPA